MSKLYSIFAIILFATNGEALAWTSNTDGPDIFGNTKVFASARGSRETFVVQCDQKEVLLVAIIFPKKKFEEISERPATLLIKANDQSPISLSATMRSWNDDYYGIVASGRTKPLVNAINAIGAARRKIQVGVDISGNQQSASFSSRGSTKSMKNVIKGCKLASISSDG